MVTGVISTAVSTTSCQASALDQFEDDFFIDWYLRFYLGTYKDNTVTVTDFAKTNGVLTWSPALGGTPDTSHYFELWRDNMISPDQVNALINEAIRNVETDYLTDKIDESLVINDVLSNGLFETWSDSSTCTGWTTTGTGTLARESTIKREGTYSAKLTNTASSVFGVYQSISNYGLFAGRYASLYAHVHCMTADRIRIRLTDGVNTWNSDYHPGHGWMEGNSETGKYLYIQNVTIDNTPTELTASFRIETGSAISAYVDKMFLITGDSIYEYTCPSGFYTISDIYQEGDTVGNFSPKYELIDPEFSWRLKVNGSTKQIWFDPDIVSLTNGRKLRIVGQAKASTLTLDADTTDVPANYITNYVKGMILKDGDLLALAERNKPRIAPRGWRVES